MQINSDNIIKDAQRLRGATEEVRNKRAAGDNESAKPTTHKIEVTLDEMSVNLRSHQQTVARLQLESIGLEQIQKGLEFVVKNNPGDFEELKRAIGETQAAADASRFKQQNLIPESIRQALFGDLLEDGQALKASEMVRTRQDEIGNEIKNELAQISRIQVSFENIQSLSMPLEGRVQTVVEELTTQLLAQNHLVQAPMDPATVMTLLRD